MRPAQLHIDLDAIRGNLASISRLVGPSVTAAPVVKANAYGHGAVEVSRACVEDGARLLCVAIPDEGIELREAGITAPILVLGPPDSEEVAPYLDHDLISTVSDVGHAAMLAEEARRRGASLPVHLKLDTGMGRHGARRGVAEELARWIAREPALRIEGVLSHFADACNPDPHCCYRQLERFRTMLAELGEFRAPVPMLHLAASAGIVRMPEAHLDAVRPGTLLYGINSGYDPELLPEGLQPVMSLVCRISTVKQIEAGQPVGYNRSWRASRGSRIAVLSLGYADGYPRALSSKADVLVGGKRFPVVGRVSMDAITVDVTDAGPVQAGDEAVLIGAQGAERVTVEELAEKAGSIVEEIMSRLSTRLPRVFSGRREQ